MRAHSLVTRCLALAAAVAAVAAAGCGPYLQYRGAPPAASPNGRLYIEVRDAREAKAGGSNHAEVGMATGTFGIPEIVHVDGATRVSDTVRALVGDAARAAGAGVTDDASSATARVIVEVQRFWCTGYSPAYKADVTASLGVYDPTGTTVRVPGMPLHAEDGGLDCKRIYRKTLTSFFDAARAMLSNPNVAASFAAAK